MTRTTPTTAAEAVGPLARETMPRISLRSAALLALASALAAAPLRTQEKPKEPAQAPPVDLRVPSDGTDRPPRLLLFQALWGMEGLPRGGKAWTREECFAKIAAEGWDGADLVATNPNEFAAIGALAEKHRLRIGLLCFPTKPEDLDVPLRAFAELHADYLNSQIFPYPIETARGTESLRKLFARTRKAGVPFFTETHRGRITQDLLQTAAVCDALPELAICADFSHYVVAYELGWGIPKELAPAFDAISRHACMIDGRVSNGEQIQVDIGPAGEAPAAQKFAGYWKKIMESWLRRAKPGDLFVFRTELGPPDYAVVDAMGAEVSDRWEQAKVMKALAIRTWNAAVQSAGIGEPRER